MYNYVISPIFLSGSSSSERPWSTNQLLKSLSVVLFSQIISNTEPTTTSQANFVLPAISHGVDYQYSNKPEAHLYSKTTPPFQNSNNGSH